MAYDSARGTVVLFGGSSLQDTWEWDGVTWTERTPPGAKPSPRAVSAMVYDSARARVVLFGGYGSGGALQDTWEWDGTTATWVERTPSTRPAGRSSHAMAYDSDRGRSILFGGNGYPLPEGTWEWDGENWHDRTLPGANPEWRADHAMAYDSARRRVVLFGGAGASTEWDTWELEARGPALQFDASMVHAGFEPSAITGLRVRAECGARFAPFGAGDVGASLFGWVTGGTGLPAGSWQPLASNEAGLTATQPWLPASGASLLEVELDSPEALNRHVLSRDRLLSYRCQSKGAFEAGDAEVALRYLEVRVRYQTPRCVNALRSLECPDGL